MARPRRPELERELVAAAVTGTRLSARCAASRLALTVARIALADVDREPDELIDLLHALDDRPARRLATDDEIDVAAMIVAHRVMRLGERGGRRIRETEWGAEDEATIEHVAGILARRYQRHLRS